MKKLITICLLVVSLIIGGMTLEAKTTKKKSRARTTQTTKRKLYKIEGNRIVTTGPTRIVVEFYTDWCKYCPPYAKVLDNVQKRLSNKITIVRINAEEYPNIAKHYNITGYPETLLLDVNGSVCDRIHGLVDEGYLYNFLAIRV